MNAHVPNGTSGPIESPLTVIGEISEVVLNSRRVSVTGQPSSGDASIAIDAEHIPINNSQLYSSTSLIICSDGYSIMLEGVCVCNTPLRSVGQKVYIYQQLMFTMERRALLSALSVVGLSSLASCADRIASAEGPTTDGPVKSSQQYPDGTGPNHINFSTLNSDNNTALHAPRTHWNSYAIIYTEPPEYRRVEGVYYVNSSTEEVISDLWYGAKDYRNGDTYAYVQPAQRIPDEPQREQFESDPSFVYDNTTNAYYRYDRHYGQVAPTNIGRNTDILEYYRWKETERTTHHGVSVITYQLADPEPNESRVPRAITGTLQVGIEDGIIYAFDVTLDDDEGELRYTYSVRPAAFPDQSWVETARTVVTTNNSSDESADSNRLHTPQ